jgi:predicted TIM-barrel fold metal-dependent hydrolase
LVFTPFADETMPFPRAAARRLLDIGDRILFGSDFPNIPYDYATAMQALTGIDGIDDDWLRGVFYRNAAKLFGLSHS